MIMSLGNHGKSYIFRVFLLCAPISNELILAPQVIFTAHLRQVNFFLIFSL